MNAEDVVEFCKLLLEHGVQLCIDGGWGVDALLEQQTRHHKDLDAFVAFDDLPMLTSVLSQHGFRLKEIWSENRWRQHNGHVPLIERDESSDEVATAFVLKDTQGREMDIHVMYINEDGSVTPAWDCNVAFSRDALQGQGSISGLPVRCLSAAMHMRTHTGYELQEKDIQDLQRLRERFDIDTPDDSA